MYENVHHRNCSKEQYNDYYKSIKELDNVMCSTNSSMYLFTDANVKTSLGNLKSIKLILFPFTEIPYYKQYYTAIQKLCIDKAYHHNSKTILIWLSKLFFFNHFVTMYPVKNKVIFVDAGCLRMDRKHFFKEWIDSGFFMKSSNKININWNFQDIKNLQNINTDIDPQSKCFTELLLHGKREIVAGHFCLDKDIVSKIYDRYNVYLQKTISMNFIPTEQRILTLTLLELFLEDPTIFSLYEGCGYFAKYHLISPRLI